VRKTASGCRGITPEHRPTRDLSATDQPVQLLNSAHDPVRGRHEAVGAAVLLGACEVAVVAGGPGRLRRRPRATVEIVIAAWHQVAHNAQPRSPKTVEANLARIYRRLQIRSRAELGAHIALDSMRKVHPLVHE